MPERRGEVIRSPEMQTVSGTTQAGMNWFDAQLPVGTPGSVRLFWVICTTRVFGLKGSTMSIRRSLFSFYAALAVVAVAAGLGGSPAKSGSDDIKIDGAWVRESPIGGSSGGGYMRIVNSGQEADRLLSAESTVAKSIILQEMSYVGEKLLTRTLSKGIEVPPGKVVQLQWSASHLLFVDLKEPFSKEQTFEAALHFEKAGRVPVQFRVRPRLEW